MEKLEKGQQVSGRYTLTNRLNQGSAGEVWLAEDQIRRQYAVLKFLSPALANKPSGRDLLTREFEQARRLIHPNIVRVLELGSQDDRLFLASEFMGENTLEALKPADYRQLVPILLPVVDALAYAHGAGLVHRDIKPSNIIMNADNQAFLSDFGLSLNADATTDLSGGSMFYMSPEQLSGETPDPRDDIYAFGATLYDLINGHPPFYPNVSPQRIQKEVPEPISSKVMLPSSFDELIFSMLAKRRDERPQTFAEVRNRLAEFTDIPDQATLPPDSVILEQPAAIEAAAFSATDGQIAAQTPSKSLTDPHKKTVSLSFGLSALAVAIIAVGLVVFLLPKFAPTADVTLTAESTGDSANPNPAAPVSATETEEEQRTPFEKALFEQQREEAERFTLALLRKIIALEEKKVELWAGEEFAQAQELAETGDKFFTDEDLDAAMQSYRDSETILDDLNTRAESIVSEMIAKGQAAIEQSDGTTAQDSFQVVLDLEPRNAVALAGLKLAGELPKIEALLSSAKLKYDTGQLQGAKREYEEVLMLQPDNAIAQQARKDINVRLAALSFEGAMSDGFAALEGKDYESARTAFERAQKIRPNAAGPKDGLAQVDLTIRGNAIEKHRLQARSLESDENWRAAADEYQRALDLDGTLVFAKQGKFRALGRTRLHNQLQTYITRSERLSNPEVFTHAGDVLRQASALPRKGPLLKKQIDTVTGLMAVARVPVRVRLESDNLTNVVMFQVGRLGNFEAHELELIPGAYTVIGTRAGYRDVRHNFIVAPGSSPPAVVVRCEDKI